MGKQVLHLAPSKPRAKATTRTSKSQVKAEQVGTLQRQTADQWRALSFFVWVSEQGSLTPSTFSLANNTISNLSEKMEGEETFPCLHQADSSSWIRTHVLCIPSSSMAELSWLLHQTTLY